MRALTFRIAACAGLLMLALPAPPAGADVEIRQVPRQRTSYASVQEAVSEQIRKDMRKYDVTGLSIALVDDQQVVWAAGFGHADRDRDIPAEPDTVYPAGSLTTLFTAAAVLKLAEQHALDLDAPLRRYLPDFSLRSRFADQRPITLRDLLTHRSGIPSSILKGMWTRRPEPVGSVVAQLKASHAAAPPGAQFAYSVIGYDLLGIAVQGASGQEYARYVRDALLLPLHMERSGFSRGAAVREYREGKEIEAPLPRDIPAEGMYTTVLDLSRFIMMLFAQGKADAVPVLTPAAVAEMLRPQNTGAPLDLGLVAGLGWMLGGLGEIDIRNAGPVAHLSGWTLLSRGQLLILPEHKLGVVVLSNSSTASRTAVRAAVKAVTAALAATAGIPQPPQEQGTERDVLLSDQIVREYAGRYASLAGLAEIRRRSGHFHAEVMGRTLHLVPHEGGWFGIKYRLLGFFPLSLGELDYYEVLRASVAGREVLKVRTKGREMIIAEKLQPAPLPGSWLRRAGSYEIVNRGEDFPLIEDIRISVDDGVLLAECRAPFLVRGTLRYPLIPVSDTEAVIAGAGRGLGETISAGGPEGREELFYSGYRLRRK